MPKWENEDEDDDVRLYRKLTVYVCTIFILLLAAGLVVFASYSQADMPQFCTNTTEDAHNSTVG